MIEGMIISKVKDYEYTFEVGSDEITRIEEVEFPKDGVAYDVYYSYGNICRILSADRVTYSPEEGTPTRGSWR